ncbi:MAG TPA: hypothetical protein VI318_01335 [Baekduia sp.]
MSHALDDLPTLRDFRDQLTALAVAEATPPAPTAPTARPRPARLRAPRRRLSLVLAALAALVIAGSAAAAALVGLRAVVIPGPRATDVAPQETIVASTARVLGVRAPDPVDHTVWTLRSARTRAGEVCLTVGQRGPGGGFGLVGLDGRFRLLAPSFADACGTAAGRDGVTLIGARTFAARRRADVRTVLYGLSAGLRSVTVAVAGQPARALTPSREGAFAYTLVGYPEDRPTRVTLRFAGGRVEVRTFGASKRLVTGTGGAAAGTLPALKLGGFFLDNANHTNCVSVTAARRVPGAAEGPTVCGSGKPPEPFGAVRAVRPGQHRGKAEGATYDWGSFPARTLAWGSWPRPLPRLRSVVLTGPTGTVRARLLDGGRAFLGVLPARARPAGVTVTVTPATGPPVTFRGSLNLVPNPLTH